MLSHATVTSFCPQSRGSLLALGKNKNMALVKCKECSVQISSKADSCPHCGAKVKKGIGCGCLLLICFVVMIFIGVIAPSSPPAGSSSRSSPSKSKSVKPARPREVVENSAWDGSVRQVKRYLDQNLKDPDSYQGIEWSNVVKTDDGRFMVRHKYRAKNGFGGYSIEEQIFILDAQGNVVSAIRK
jgi:hypothetical protein